MTKKITLATFIERSVLIHGNRYDYSNSVLNGITKPISIVCQVHGEFRQIANSHSHGGHGCPACAGNKKSTTEIFIEKCNKIHNYKYSYEAVFYKNATSKIIITCKDHGNFEQAPTDHLGGKGCFVCAHDSIGLQSRKLLADFISESNEIHNFKYNYSESLYTGAYTKVKIICPVHGPFYQNPICHSTGKGCAKCYKNISKAEIKWLDSLNIPANCRQHTIIIENKKFKVDAFMKETNTIYEFWGDFWHGNPDKFKTNDINHVNKKTFGQLYDETMRKRQTLQDAGYSLIEIWENDFNNKENNDGK